MAKTSSTGKYLYFGPQGIGGGLSSENPIVVEENKMVVADNILIGTALTRRKRGGQENFHTGELEGTSGYIDQDVPVRGIVEYWRTANLDGASISDIFLHQGEKVWSIDDRNTAAIDRTGSLVLSDIGVPSYQVFNDKLYFCSTVTADGYNKWDGTSPACAAATAPPDGCGKYLTSHLGRMVMAGNDDFPYRIYLSTTGSPENWNTSGPDNATSLDLISDGDPQGITGITSFQSRLYAFTRTCIYEITGNSPDTFIVNKVTNGIGCIGHASICQTPNDIYFCSDRGIHSLRQLEAGRQTTSTFLSRDIQRLWIELINTSLFSRVKAIYDEKINSYILSVPSSGQLKNDQLLVYNTEFNTWTVWPNINARSLCIAYLSNKKEILMGKEDGKIAFINRPSTNDFGAGYSARFKTGVLYPGSDLSVEKRFNAITVFASTTTTGQFNVNWTIDGKKTGGRSFDLIAATDVLGSTFILGQSKLGVGQYVPHTCSIEEIGYGIQIEIVSTGVSDLEFYGYILEAEDVNPNYS